MCVSQVFVAFCDDKVIQYLEKENQSVARNDVTDELKISLKYCFHERRTETCVEAGLSALNFVQYNISVLSVFRVTKPVVRMFFIS